MRLLDCNRVDTIPKEHNDVMTGERVNNTTMGSREGGTSGGIEFNTNE